MAEAIWQFYGACVRMHRLRKGWNQQRLADELNFASKASISDIESGQAVPSGATIIEMARVFGVSPSSMLTEHSVAMVTMESVLIQAIVAFLQLVPDTDGQRRVIAQVLEAMAQAIKQEARRPEEEPPAPGAPA